MADLGIGLGQELGLAPAERDALAAYARQRGYASTWTNARATRDPFDACARWTRDGMTAGISVVPLDAWDPGELARVTAATAASAPGFVLGVGSGRMRRGALDLVRGAIAVLRGSVPDVPIYVGALGPRMLRLAGEAADGAALNWCNAERVRWSRDRVAEGARRAGRDPGAVRVVGYVRVCIDEDDRAARAALATAMLGYALAGPRRPKDSGYRSHFTQMGFDILLTDLEARRGRGEPIEDLARSVPPELLNTVGVSGTATAAASAFEALSAGLDLPIARVVASRAPAVSARAVIDACSTARSR